jgi:hypothetical protein
MGLPAELSLPLRSNLKLPSVTSANAALHLFQGEAKYLYKFDRCSDILDHVANIYLIRIHKLDLCCIVLVANSCHNASDMYWTGNQGVGGKELND